MCRTHYPCAQVKICLKGNGKKRVPSQKDLYLSPFFLFFSFLNDLFSSFFSFLRLVSRFCPFFPPLPLSDTLAWATGTHVGARDHAIALFCIGCGRVLGVLYSDKFTSHFEVKLRILMSVPLYMWL